MEFIAVRGIESYITVTVTSYKMAGAVLGQGMASNNIFSCSSSIRGDMFVASNLDKGLGHQLAA